MKQTGKKAKNTIGIALIYVILLGVFNLLVFLIFQTRTEVFWISYGFMTLAFVVQIASMLLSFRTADVETAFFGIPLASFSVFYLCVALAVGVLFMIFQMAGFVLALILQILILAAFLIIAILSLLARDAVRDMGNQVTEKVRGLKTVLVDVETLAAASEDLQLRAALTRLADTVRYSDPMSNEAVADVEQRILGKLSELRIYTYHKQVDEAMESCKQLELLYLERNKKLAISK